VYVLLCFAAEAVRRAYNSQRIVWWDQTPRQRVDEADCGVWRRSSPARHAGTVDRGVSVGWFIQTESRQRTVFNAANVALFCDLYNYCL